MSENGGNEEEIVQRKWLLTISATLIVAIGVAFVAFAVIGSVNGSLSGWWQGLTEGQGAVIAQVFTLYAAAFAAIFVPLIFRGEIKDLKSQLNAANAEIRALAEESRNSFRILNEYALQQAGIKSRYSAEDLPNAVTIVEHIRTQSAALCQQFLDNSKLHGRTKSLFQGKWPGNKPYVRLLDSKGVIDAKQRAKFFLIAESSKYTREQNREAITLPQLNILASTLFQLSEDLKKSKDED